MATSEIETPVSALSQGSESSRPAYLGVRLGILIFLAFSIMGAWMPVFTLHLKNLEFSPEWTAWASATNALGAMVAPLLWGQIADRWLAKERCISWCALIAGVGLLALAEVRDPLAMTLGCVALWFFLVPVMGLTGAFIFRQLEHPDRDFGKIRLWGTIGWMAANWGLTLWFEAAPWLTGSPRDLGDSMRLGGLMALILTCYALTMPHAPPHRAQGTHRRFWLLQAIDAPLRAARLLKQGSFLVYCACMFGFYVTMAFTIQLNALLLGSIGVESGRVPLYLTICQVLEVALLSLLPVMLFRLGVKATMTIGASAWTVGLLALGIGKPFWLVLIALSSGGVFICCFVISGQVFVNRQATPDIRASAQGLLVFINGFGLLLGHLLVGWIRDWSGDRYDIAYLLAASVSAILLVLFSAGFSADLSTKPGNAPLVPPEKMP